MEFDTNYLADYCLFWIWMLLNDYLFIKRINAHLLHALLLFTSFLACSNPQSVDALAYYLKRHRHFLSRWCSFPPKPPSHLLLKPAARPCFLSAFIYQSRSDCSRTSTSLPEYRRYTIHSPNMGGQPRLSRVRRNGCIVASLQFLGAFIPKALVFWLRRLFL